MSTCTKETFAIPTEAPGVNLNVWYFRPAKESQSTFPVVVAGPGLTVTKEAGLGHFGERWAAIGWSSLVLDFRGFGTSDSGKGEKDVASIARQVDDYRSVVRWAQKQEFVQRDKIVLLGTAFSGMSVAQLALNAKSEGIAGIMAQCPLLDGYATLSTAPANPRLIFWACLDYIAGLVGLPPIYIKAVGKPQEFALLTSPSCHAGFTMMFSKGSIPFSKAPNRLAPRVAFETMSSRAGSRLKDSQCPFLVTMPTFDDMNPIFVNRDLVQKAEGKVQMVELPGGHFDVMPGGQCHEDNIEAQLNFLRSL